MIMKRIISVSVLAAALAVPSFAQGIKQSVEVTNEYVSGFADFKKSTPQMAVPDSVYRFDYSFDYSVFESPYRGAYEFSPYEIQLTPDPLPYDGKKLYLSAGAGYSLHPVLDVVYTPFGDGAATLSLFNKGRGYSGKNFYDLTDNAGLSGRLLTSWGRLSYKAGYEGIFAGAGEPLRGTGAGRSTWHSPYVGVALESRARGTTYFDYKIGVDYRFSTDGLYSLPASSTAVPSAGRIGEHDLRVSGFAGPVVKSKYSFLLDFGFNMLSLADSRTGYSDRVASFARLTPHLKFVLGIVDIDAGVNLDYFASADSSPFSLNPVVKAGLDISELSLKLFAGLDGGKQLLGEHSLKSFNHFYVRGSAVPDVSWEKADIYLGALGKIGPSLQYSIKGGYALRSSSPFDSAYGSLAFADCSSAHASLGLDWVSERFDLDAAFDFESVFMDALSVPAYAPAMFRGHLDATWNTLERVFVGLRTEGASSREDVSGLGATLKGYVDLGLYGEYRFDRSWGVWLHAGNLIGMQIERHPGYVEKGPYFTLGVRLSM